MSCDGVDLTRRETFPHWIDIQIRYNDQDTLGHINNVVYSAYLEHARCDLIYGLAGMKAYPRLETVIVRAEIDFRLEINYPGTVQVGTVLTRTGRSSFDLCHGMFSPGSNACHSTAKSVMAWFDLDTRRTTAPPTDIAAGLDRYRPPGGSKS
jgi:acyl-CoA thioester hydrolase